MTHTRALWQCRNRYILSLYPPSVNSAAAKPQRQASTPRPPWLPAAAQYLESLLRRHLPKAHSRLHKKSKPTFAQTHCTRQSRPFFPQRYAANLCLPAFVRRHLHGKTQAATKKTAAHYLYFSPQNLPYAVVLCALVWRNVAKNAFRLHFFDTKRRAATVPFRRGKRTDPVYF